MPRQSRLALLSMLGGMVLLLTLPTSARAANCAQNVAVPADGRVAGPFALGNNTNPGTTDTSISVAVHFEPNRSYSIDATEVLGTGNAGINIDAAGSSGCPGNDPFVLGATIRDITTVSPNLRAPLAQRKSVILSSAYVEVDGWGRLWNNSAANTSGNITVTETTQFSPAWVTSGTTYNTFYSFFNTTNNSCNINLSLFDKTGAAQGTVSTSLPSQLIATTNTMALGTTRGLAGNAVLTHDCPPGGIVSEAAIANFTLTPPYFQGVKFVAAHEVH